MFIHDLLFLHRKPEFNCAWIKRDCRPETERTIIRHNITDAQYDTIRYDTMDYINVRSKAHE